MTLLKRFRGLVVLRTRRRGSRIEVRVARLSDAQQFWLSVSEEEYRSGLTCQYVARSPDASDGVSHESR